MPETHEMDNVSIRYTLTLEDGTLISSSAGGDCFDYEPDQQQIMPVVEEALRGTEKGEKKRIILSPVHDPGLKLDATRLAFLLGHPGEVLVLEVEIL